MNNVKRIVSNAEKKRKNRVYYDKYFRTTDLRECGFLQSYQKSLYDRVILDESTNETVRYYGFDKNGSYFELYLSVLSLFSDIEKPEKELNLRLASAKFTYLDSRDNVRYDYSTKQLLDYTEKRKRAKEHESRNIYKIDSISIEIVSPFSLSRILFNGYLTRSSGETKDLVSSKITISTHPNCDKYDYKFRFDQNFLTKTLLKAQQSDKVDKNETKRLINLTLEDRIDTPLMYQGRLEILDEQSPVEKNFLLFGAKVKKLIQPIIRSPEMNEPIESVYIWSESGHQIHLSRPVNHKQLIYGLVNSTFDYASSLYDFKLLSNQSNQTELDLNNLQSFSKLSSGMRIYLKAFGTKEYNIDIEDDNINENGFMAVSVNSFKGWALFRTDNVSDELIDAQKMLWSLNIHDRKFAPALNSEHLLGGKGSSLINLNKLTKSTISNELFKPTEMSPGVSVPRGIVVSCVAYNIWLRSNQLIEAAILELDYTRRALAARSIHTNSLSQKYMPLSQKQQILKDQCRKTSLVLNSCPLPPILIKYLTKALRQIFSAEELIGPSNENEDGDDDDDDRYKKYAIRSSAVGEDSLETSAAGQMKTILDARGLASIFKSIVECWSSQFEFEPVQYKTQNGLDFNLPMAVVVQELISCKAAGVATTCDPLSGNKSSLQILANLGLGEGVVSGNKTDTVQVSLRSLEWNPDLDEPKGYLSGENEDSSLYKVLSDDKSRECCLTKEQILALASLMVWLRRNNEIKDREVEWGITNQGSSFHIHLLQSRPLTHLSKLDSYEIDHELDYGHTSPLNLISRANLGEVMPGALCPLTSTYFIPLAVNTSLGEKPFEVNHTYKTFTSNSFTFHGQLIAMVLTYTDTIKRFAQPTEDVDLENKKESEEKAVVFRTMIGANEEMAYDPETRIKLAKERVNPFAKLGPRSLFHVIALDSGLYGFKSMRAKKVMNNIKLEKRLTNIDSYIDKLENSKKGSRLADIEILVRIDIDICSLFEELTGSAELIALAWENHIRATILNMVFNTICMKILSKQPYYPDSMSSGEILNDFSVLMRVGDQQTESGNISTLLAKLIDFLIEDGKFHQVKVMNNKELYNYLIDSAANPKGAAMFNEFMKQNGHRSFKEFDFSTLTWSEDPSYIVKSLAARLKQHSPEEAAKERQSNEARAKDQKDKAEEILSKIQNAKALLVKYILPRCRNATLRREESKSFLIKTIGVYRTAFRHLGALLCLAGRLPSADMIYQLSIEELVSFVYCRNRPDLSRILYKARRRQQRANVLNRIMFPRPVMIFDEMIELVRQSSQKNPTTKSNGLLNDQSVAQVKGITSCSGCVTGRACVVSSLDDMDQIEPNDILITYSIDISWSVYFFTLAGIVTEVGGIVSHGAVVAREYGIPTLCTAIGACSIFKTGQIVTLDANQGICYLASDLQQQETTDKESR